MVIPQPIIEDIGFKAKEIILRRIGEGKDTDGNKFRYSRNPFAMPYSPKLAKRLGKAGHKIFKRNGGKLWMLVHGGYYSIRKAKGRGTENDFLQDEGTMLKALGVRTTADSAILSFTDALQAKKAYWLNISGVGKRRVLWKFMGLNKQEQDELAEFATRLLLKNTSAEAIAKMVVV